MTNKTNGEPSTTLAEQLQPGSSIKSQILHVAAEVEPFSASAGLGQVIKGLPENLANEQGHEVVVVTPWYKKIDDNYTIKTIAEGVEFPFDHPNTDKVDVGERIENGVRYLFVKHPDFYDRDGKNYGHDDDNIRFARFCRAIPQAVDAAGFTPDVVHCHDWQTGYLPLILKHSNEESLHSNETLLPSGWKDLPSIFTIHRGEYFAPADPQWMTKLLRLPADVDNHAHYTYDGVANPLWAGAGNADVVSTVSETYAKELMANAHPQCLRFGDYFKEIVGLPNGAHPMYNPQAKHGYIPHKFDANSLENKELCKEELCKDFKLDPNRPTFGFSSRMNEDKGFGIIADSIDELVEQGWNLVLAGPSYDKELMEKLQQKAEQYPDFVRYIPGFAEAPLTHKILASTDATLIPSKTEPFGLVQVHAQVYGGIPIGHKTGGIADTIEDGKTGFLFEDRSKEGLLNAAQRAIDIYKGPENDLSKPSEEWQNLQRNCLALDYSWDKTASAYSKICDKLMHEKTKWATNFRTFAQNKDSLASFYQNQPSLEVSTPMNLNSPEDIIAAAIELVNKPTLDNSDPQITALAGGIATLADIRTQLPDADAIGTKMDALLEEFALRQERLNLFKENHAISRQYGADTYFTLNDPDFQPRNEREKEAQAKVQQFTKNRERLAELNTLLGDEMDPRFGQVRPQKPPQGKWTADFNNNPADGIEPKQNKR